MIRDGKGPKGAEYFNPRLCHCPRYWDDGEFGPFFARETSLLFLSYFHKENFLYFFFPIPARIINEYLLDISNICNNLKFLMVIQ